MIAEVDSAEVEAYADNQVTEPLMEKTPKAGKIKKETKMMLWAILSLRFPMERRWF